MTQPTGIMLLEGADSSGKTTLAKFLVERFGARNLHSTVRKDIYRWHAGALRRAIRESNERLVVMDRHWHSEMIYGPIFRGRPGYNIGARGLDRIMRRYAVLTILCAPKDQRAQEERWKAGRVNGKFEHFDSVREVIARYADLRDGNVAHPGDSYLDQLIRFQDFRDRDDVLVYDMDTDGRNLGRFAGIAVGMLQNLRRRAIDLDPNRHNLIGRPDPIRPSVLFVGEALSPRTKEWAPTIPRYPWVDRDEHLGAATWMNRALHHLAIREDRTLFTNAIDPDDHLPRLLRHLRDTNDVQVIALGTKAAERLRRLGETRFATIVHPQFHRRFHYPDGPEAYATIINEVLRDRDTARYPRVAQPVERPAAEG